MAVDDGESHHGDDVGDQEEGDLEVMIEDSDGGGEDLIAVVEEGDAGVPVRPDDETGVSGLVSGAGAVEDRGGVDQAGSGHGYGHHPDHAQHHGGRLLGEVRGPGPGDGHVPLHRDGRHQADRRHYGHVRHEVRHAAEDGSEGPISGKKDDFNALNRICLLNRIKII